MWNVKTILLMELVALTIVEPMPRLAIRLKQILSSLPPYKLNSPHPPHDATTLPQKADKL